MRYVITDPDLAAADEDERYRIARFGHDIHRAFRKVIGLIRSARDVRDLYAVRALKLEKLKADRAGQYSMRLNDQYRLIVLFKTDPDGQVMVVVEIVDYH